MAKEGGQMWRWCAQWLCDLEVLPTNHKVMTTDATFQDLAYTLRDGVLLCQVAISLDEASLNSRTVNFRPQMAQFLCLQNIKLFLVACKNTFDLKGSDLFEAPMLYDFTDFAKVLQTLSALSQSPKVRAAKPHISSWSSIQKDLDDEDMEEKEEVIYKQLEAEADEDTYQEFYLRHRTVGGAGGVRLGTNGLGGGCSESGTMTRGHYGYVWGNNQDELDGEGARLAGTQSR